jgi:hypothetical protein
LTELDMGEALAVAGSAAVLSPLRFGVGEDTKQAVLQLDLTPAHRQGTDVGAHVLNTHPTFWMLRSLEKKFCGHVSAL